MRQIKLIEFANKADDLLRGILVSSGDSAKVVLMCGGFERSATTEKKFKALADRLIENNISSLRFDCAGCGLSDGDFSKTTVKRMTDDLRSAVEFLKEEAETENISLVCHSLSACAAGRVLDEANFKKIVLIAPALNQKDLLRYWFTKQEEESKKINIKINWNNFKNYLDEKRFRKDCLRTDKMTKANYISSAYFLENKDKDYSALFKKNDNVFLARGDKDDKVPLESLNIKFKNEIIVKGGDHDIERPDMFEQWIEKTVDFLK
ncbi:lysophospholipase [Patescibacteria group bacterium]|nr:lysophospholipase [Patescibacteria group bacterium]MBU4579896.1 lysophospholipase [Patescibacteria group bacterium]